MIKTFILLCLLLICFGNKPLKFKVKSEHVLKNQSYASRCNTSNTVDKCKMLGFRYLVISNELLSPNSRHIEIFLDEKAFSEKNLKILFTHFGTWYPEPYRITINVKTDWSQIQLPLPPECPALSDSGTGNDSPSNFFEAVYYRRNVPQKKEIFRYRPNPNKSEFRTILLSQ